MSCSGYGSGGGRVVRRFRHHTQRCCRSRPARRWRRSGRLGPPGQATAADDDQCRAASQKNQPGDHQTDDGRQQPVHLDPQSGVEIDTATGVGVHHHDRPVSALDLPRQLVGLVGGHLGRPEGLICGRRRCRLPGQPAVDDPVRGQLEIADPVVTDIFEVRGDVGAGTDPGEYRRVRTPRIDAQPYGAERPPVDQPVRPAGLALQVDAVRGDRVRRRREPNLAGLEEPVRALGGVADQRRRPAGEQTEPDQRQQRADDDHHDPADLHPRPPPSRRR